MALLVQIEKQFGAFRLSVNFRSDGGTLGILGASGCGKTVTLRCIAGLLRPDAGRIELNGRVLFDSEQRIDLPPQQRRVGCLFQQYALFPNMTVEQNIRAGVRGGTRAEKKAVTDRALRSFRLEDVKNQYPHTLSGGQQQRTALARILVGKPEALLLDEPFSALDEYLKAQLCAELSETLRTYRGDVLFVSHAKDEIERLCQSVCVLDDGASEPPCSTETLLHTPPSPAAARLAGYRNVTEAVPQGDGLFCPAWGLALSWKADARSVCIPEDALHLAKDGEDAALTCEIVEAFTEGGRRLWLLRPCPHSGDGVLYMLPQTENAVPGGPVSVAIEQGRLLFWHKTVKNES